MSAHMCSLLWSAVAVKFDQKHLVMELFIYELLHQKMYLGTGVPSEDSDQPAHSRSLIRIFTWRILDSQVCRVSLW